MHSILYLVLVSNYRPSSKESYSYVSMTGIRHGKMVVDDGKQNPRASMDDVGKYASIFWGISESPCGRASLLLCMLPKVKDGEFLVLSVVSTSFTI